MGTSICVEMSELACDLETVINETLQKYKSDFMKRLFNTESVTLKSMVVTMPKDVLEGEKVEICRSDGQIVLSYNGKGIRYNGDMADQNISDQFGKSIVAIFLSRLLQYLLNGADEKKRQIYLPAARTGFMLTKDIINKVARKNTFDLEMELEDDEQIQPFSRPIIDFLDVIGDLQGDQNGMPEYQELIGFMQQQMICGNIEIGVTSTKELGYVPDGQDTIYPFRATSAVVTELSPLLLLLQHKNSFFSLFYEEPELCLHPALQKKMGQLLVQMSNMGIDLMITTHSDIILQHVNNMIRLKHEQIATELEYTEKDLLDKDKVRVYQFVNSTGGMTSVKELGCGDYGFAIPSFNNTLDGLMSETIQIQGGGRDIDDRG